MPGAALETHAEIGTAAEHHSNALRTNTDEQSDTLYALIGRFGLREASPSLDADLHYDIENRRYADDSFGDENVANGNASIDWHIVQNNISLLVDHNIADTTADSAQPDTPDNRTRRSVLAVGPRFTGRLSSVDDLSLTARKVDIDVDDIDLPNTPPEAQDPNDSERDEVTLQWDRRLPNTRNFFAGVSYADVTFDNAPAQDYRYTAAFIGMGFMSRLTALSISVGVNKAERDDANADDTDGQTINVTLSTRDNAAPFQGSLYYIKAITDSSIGFVGQSSLPPTTDSDSENLDVVDIVERVQTGLTSSLALGDHNTHLTLDASLQKQDYQEELRDDEIRRIGIGIERRSTEKLTTRVYAGFNKQKFLDEDTDDEERRLGILTSYAVTDAFDVHVDAYRVKHDYSVDTLSYRDTVIRLELTYSFDSVPTVPQN